MPPGVILTDIEAWFMDEVERRSGGRITFKRIFGGPLGTISAQSENLKGRVFDIGKTSFVYFPGLHPLGTVTTLPAIELDSRAWSRAANELMREPALAAEFTALDQKHLFTWALEPMEMMSHVPVHSLDDLKGLRIRVHGGAALAGAKLGWTGVKVVWEELPVVAAGRGIDASVHPVYITGRDAGLHYIFPYYIAPFPIYQFHWATAMNLDAWHELPPDLQQLMLDVSKEAAEYGLRYLEEKKVGGLRDLAEAGVITINWPAAEWAKFVELAAEPVWEDWVAKQEAARRPGRAVLDKFLELLDKHG
jgi:TRAP-type C4-dicarboxylate transport system substrate-binding protein